MAKKINIPKDGNIIPIPLEEAMPDNYLPYAVEVAKDRALPDVRDGMKPVHRRILYGSYLLRAFPDKPYYKSARIVGDILGKFHPHGDTSVYDAMVILAQNFTTRYPLIDGHGNWGSIDGDGAAAMRYTEARLAPIAMEMIKDIDKGTVDMVPNYSDSEMEPAVLPSRYPNLLVNGAFGIAVGLATNIPPHNLKEVVDGITAYIDNPDITTKELMKYIKGPDLPTGGILIGRDSIHSAYETGEGKVTLRAKANIEKLENGRLGIVITEFPYRKNKAKLLQSISEMTGDKRHAKALESIVDIRDESDRTGIRAVIEFKKSTEMETADKVLKYLYKRTDLQCNLSFNMVALADGKPQTLGLKQILVHYVNHQKEIITRRSRRELDDASKRFHIVEGFIKAIDIMDEIIAVIRSSKSKKDAGDNLQSKFGFTEAQANAILELMLYRLTGLEIKVFQKEYKELEKLIAKLNKILNNEKELIKVVKNELLEITERYKDDRRTEIIADEQEAKIDIEELLVVEDIMVTISKDGFAKRVPLKNYNRTSGEVDSIEYREGDYAKYVFQSNTRDIIMVFTDKGNMFQFRGNLLPEAKWRDKGERIDTLIKGLDLDKESIIAAYTINDIKSPLDYIFITAKGNIKKSSLDKFETSYTKLQAIKLKDGDSLVMAELMDRNREEEFIRIALNNDLHFTIIEPKLLSTERNILPQSLILLPDKLSINSAEIVKDYALSEYIVGISPSGNIKLVKSNKRDDYFKARVTQEDYLLIFTDSGKVYRIPAVILESLENTELHLEDIADFTSKKEKVLNIVSSSMDLEKGIVYYFTSNGLIKKTALKEFSGEYTEILGYKFKSEGDVLINIDISFEEEINVLIITSKGMAIKFDSSNVNLMGKGASGVIGISLKDEDRVIYGGIVSADSAAGSKKNNLQPVVTDESLIVLKTNKKESKLLKIDEIKVQNRAGRGNNIFLILMNDYIKDVKIK
ncbi:DNA topoisomerase IV subunit A [Alloiococcus sp. CFN-8]|uniref:DNA topoisomerase IV subunit A n=1 Tax=Alloiococcus sp. CFN-8 TaxID=3416081 RepID=UPI003CF5F25E